MCDYSLHNVASRPAKVGDELTTRDFGTGTHGFAASEDSRVAVCALPGPNWRLPNRSNMQRKAYWAGAGRRSIIEWAIFRQINKERAASHHDALEFPDGKVILLNRLLEGQEAVVLQLPARPATASEAESQKRVVQVGWVEALRDILMVGRRVRRPTLAEPASRAWIARGAEAWCIWPLCGSVEVPCAARAGRGAGIQFRANGRRVHHAQSGQGNSLRNPHRGDARSHELIHALLRLHVAPPFIVRTRADVADFILPFAVRGVSRQPCCCRYARARGTPC
jgi:hypothetical protein